MNFRGLPDDLAGIRGLAGTAWLSRVLNSHTVFKC